MVNTFSVAQALWENRQRMAEVLPELRAVRECLQAAAGGPRDFVQQQWVQLASTVYAFKPDLIIELGRGYGNSTCSMAIGAKMLQPLPCRILSLCLSTSFNDVTRPYLDSALTDQSLFAPLEALTCDISSYDFRADIEDARRVFIFWDAHGYDLAMGLLSGLFSQLQGKPHLAIVHDMADLKYMEPECRRYGNESAWLKFGSAPPKYILGDVGAQYEEGIALVDFLGRNRIPFKSAESSYFPELSELQLLELNQLFGADFSRYGFWYSFSLTEGKGPLTFPTIANSTEIPAEKVGVLPERERELAPVKRSIFRLFRN